MRRFACAGLFLAASAFAQQQGTPPYNLPPTTTPPTFPQEQSPPDRMPPDTKAPAPRKLSDAEVRQQVEEKLAAEPLLSNLQLDTKVNRASVVLMGIVNSEEQHQLALRIAESYAGQRRIIDKIKVRS